MKKKNNKNNFFVLISISLAFVYLSNGLINKISSLKLSNIGFLPTLIFILIIFLSIMLLFQKNDR